MTGALIKELHDALAALLKRDQRNTCTHEETHRGGTLWEICDQCGVKWADDQGGRPEWEDPEEWGKAQDAIDKAQNVLQIAFPEIDGLDQAERNLLVALLYDKVDAYTEIARSMSMAPLVVHAISEEQERLKRLANKISRQV